MGSAGLDVAQQEVEPKLPRSTEGSPRLIVAGLLIVFACSATVLLLLQSRLTFVADDWSFLLDRRGSSAAVFLDPHNNHIVVVPVSIYKGLLEVFGMNSALPFQIAATGVFLLSNLALFVYLCRRVGAELALLGTTLILFLGAAWIDLLWSFQIALSGSIAAGLAALLALEREEQRSDAIGCALLVVAVAFSELGVSFALAALVSVALGPHPRWRRLYVALLPLALYAIWFLGWGHKGPETLTAHNVLVSPKYVFEAISQAIASLLGLATPLTGSGLQPVGLIWGELLLVAGIILAVWRVRRVGGISRGLWTALTLGGSFWFLAAASAYLTYRLPTNGRYQFPGAVFVLLIAAELLRGIRPTRQTLLVAVVVTAAAVVSGLLFLHKGYRIQRSTSVTERTELGALEIARPDVSPASEVPLNLLTQINAGAYFSAVDDFGGSPALTASQLASSSEVSRGTADATLATLLNIRLAAVPGATGKGDSRRRCQATGANVTAGHSVPLVPGINRLLADGEPAGLRLARFADRSWIELGSLGVDTIGAVQIPRDRSARAWRLEVVGPGSVTLCRPASRQLPG